MVFDIRTTFDVGDEMTMTQASTRPKISVIIPSLNQGKYLEECIKSILIQNYPNLELFIIDGQSTDQTISIIKQYEHEIDYWVSEADQGQSDAINKGLAIANGELLAWLNADDFYLPKALDKVVDVYCSDTNSPFYFGNGLRVDKNGNVIKEFFPPDSLKFNRDALLLGLNYILQPSTFINHQYLQEVGFLDVSLHYGMDSDLWMRLSQVGIPKSVPAILSASREYETTKTSMGSFERVEELRKISMRHSDLEITPGIICYFLDTLHSYLQQGYLQQDDHTFSKSYISEVSRFWQKTSELFKNFGANSDGFPK
jgi:glycosyltransferase involved in cell wall biosynthesis